LPILRAESWVPDADARITDEAKAAADSYAQAFSSSEDALAKLVRDIGDGAGQAASWVGDRLRGT